MQALGPIPDRDLPLPPLLGIIGCATSSSNSWVQVHEDIWHMNER